MFCISSCKGSKASAPGAPEKAPRCDPVTLFAVLIITAVILLIIGSIAKFVVLPPDHRYYAMTQWNPEAASAVFYTGVFILGLLTLGTIIHCCKSKCGPKSPPPS